MAFDEALAERIRQRPARDHAGEIDLFGDHDPTEFPGGGGQG